MISNTCLGTYIPRDFQPTAGTGVRTNVLQTSATDLRGLEWAREQGKACTALVQEEGSCSLPHQLEEDKPVAGALLGAAAGIQSCHGEQ